MTTFEERYSCVPRRPRQRVAVARRCAGHPSAPRSTLRRKLYRPSEVWDVVNEAERLATRRGPRSDQAQGEVGPSLGGALEALEFARWDDLPDAALPWDRVAELAAAQGISEADVVWDLTAGLHARGRGAEVGGGRLAGGDRLGLPGAPG